MGPRKGRALEGGEAFHNGAKFFLFLPFSNCSGSTIFFDPHSHIPSAVSLFLFEGGLQIVDWSNQQITNFKTKMSLADLIFLRCSNDFVISDFQRSVWGCSLHICSCPRITIWLRTVDWAAIQFLTLLAKGHSISASNCPFMNSMKILRCDTILLETLQ